MPREVKSLARVIAHDWKPSDGDQVSWLGKVVFWGCVQPAYMVTFNLNFYQEVQ